jgi:2'-5' RNA ligase
VLICFNGHVQMAKIRSFIALDLPDNLKKNLQNLQDKARKHTDCVRWVKPDNIHLTLKFLGAIEESQVEPIARILENMTIGIAPFRLQVKGFGAFPNARNPKVIWVGMDDNQQRVVLFQEKLEETLTAIGFAPEKRTYSPHLTLGRVKESRAKRDIEQLIEKYKNEDLGYFTADTIVFYQSVLQPSGPVYSSLKTIQL